MKIYSKSAGALGVIFGVCLLVAVAFVAQRKGWPFLLLEQSDLWLVRYSIVILFINGPLWFIMSGVLIWIGVFPVNALKSTPTSRAIGVVFSLFPLPMWIAMSTVVYTLSDSLFWITAWTVFMGYWVFATVRGITKMIRPR